MATLMCRIWCGFVTTVINTGKRRGCFILNKQREGTRESVVSGLAVCGLPLSQGVKEAKSWGFVPAQHGSERAYPRTSSPADCRTSLA